MLPFNVEDTKQEKSENKTARTRHAIVFSPWNTPALPNHGCRWNEVVFFLDALSVYSPVSSRRTRAYFKIKKSCTQIRKLRKVGIAMNDEPWIWNASLGDSAPGREQQQGIREGLEEEITAYPVFNPSYWKKKKLFAKSMRRKFGLRKGASWQDTTFIFLSPVSFFEGAAASLPVPPSYTTAGTNLKL